MHSIQMSTPTYKHLNTKDFDQLYEPSEDTFLLIDALECDESLINMKRPLFVLEVGPGSGIVITFLKKLMKEPCYCIATDVNSFAAISTKRTSEENGADVQVTVDSLAQCFCPRLFGNVDILLFNPPYVVTPSEEVGNGDLSAAWAGGENGREVIDSFLPYAIRLLSRSSYFYLVVIDQNNPNEIAQIMQNYGFTSKIVIQRRTGPEYLSVLRFEPIK